MTRKLTTRGPAAALAIRDRIPFETHGALRGTTERWHGVGRLDITERALWWIDIDTIDYVVYSYATPIAWHTPAGWHRVAQRFSPTTSKHQGKLYLLPAADAP